MNDNVLSTWHDLASRGLSDEETARALLDLTLQAAPPEVADAVRLCALPAWFDAELLALLTEPISPADEESVREPSLPPRREELEGSFLLEGVTAFSFVLPREKRGYIYDGMVRARLLDWWRKPENRPRFTRLNDRLARHHLALVREQVPHLGGPDYLDALTTLDAAYSNIRAILEEAAKSDEGEIVRGFAYALADYFRCRGLWADWITWTQAGLDACELMDDTTGAAVMQSNLGEAYFSLPTGDRGANLVRAIECYQAALRFYTPDAAPCAYATVQNNLGNAYRNLITGERAANLARAIECYQAALAALHTPEAAPIAYAAIQSNLGLAYSSLPTEDQAANLRQTIACYTEALRFYTPEIAPVKYVMLQNNLGEAYRLLSTGDKVANLEKAIDCYREARRFQTQQTTKQQVTRPKTVTWLHLSDLHFRESHKYDEYIILQTLLDDVSERITKDGLQPDFIIVSGDVAFASRPEEYALARRFFEDLLRTVDLPKEYLFLVPGNHDVDRNTISTLAAAATNILTTRAAVSQCLTHDGDRALIFHRFHNYRDFVNGYLGKEHIPFDDSRYFYARSIEVSGWKVAILGLNSAWLASSDKDRNQLLLGERQVRTTLTAAKDADLRLAVMHHPFDWLQDFDRRDVEPMLGASCNFILHGHMHQVGLLQVRTPDTTPMIIAAGACYETREYPNSYNFVQLNPNTGKGKVYLRMYSDQQGGFWAKDTGNYHNAPDGEYAFVFP